MVVIGFHEFLWRENMTITFVQFIVWLIIAAIIGFLGELIAGRRAPAGIIGAIMVGLFAIFLIVGFFHFSIAGEPTISGVPLVSTIIAAIMLVIIWSSLASRRL
jgi:uncharacterized membrane protein YeaQ/YmgE (transglycosylase-associated protein family)